MEKVGKYITNYIKGKTPKVLLSDEETDSLPYLSPDYLRGVSAPEFYAKQDTKSIVVDDGEVIVLWDGSNAGEILISKKGVLASTMTMLQFDEKQIDKAYFGYSFQNLEYILKAKTAGSGIPHADKGVINKLEFYKPTLSEQSAIAAILSKVDEAITSVQASISAAERLKKSLMQNLLTGRMKPDGTLRKDDEFYVDEKFGKVPKGWEVKRIDEIAERKTDVIDPTKTKEVYDYIGLEHIIPNEFTRCGKGLSNETVALKVKFNKGDLLYGKLRPYLNKVFISDISGVGSTEFIVLKQNEFTNWVYLNFQLQRFLDYTKSMTAGTQHPRASWKDIKHYLVCMPKDEQEKESIENKLLSLEQYKISQSAKIEKLERLKKSLMQNLLTGSVRVK